MELLQSKLLQSVFVKNSDKTGSVSSVLKSPTRRNFSCICLEVSKAKLICLKKYSTDSPRGLYALNINHFVFLKFASTKATSISSGSLCLIVYWEYHGERKLSLLHLAHFYRTYKVLRILQL